MQARSEPDFESAWEDLVSKYEATHAEVLEYLLKTWIPHADKLMCYSTNKVFHLGCAWKSRVEECLSEIQRYGSCTADSTIQSPTRDLKSVVTQIVGGLEIQAKNIIAALRLEPDFNMVFTQT